MKIRIHKLKLSTALYLLFIIVATFNYSMEASVIKNPLRQINLVIIFTIAICLIILKKYTIKKICLLVLALIYGALDYYLSGYTDMLILLLAAYIADRIDFNQVIKVLFWEKLIIFVTLNLLAISGAIEMTTLSVNKFFSIATAYGPGYGSTNVYGCQAGVLILLYWVANRYNLNKLKIIVPWLFEIVIYMICRSRTGLLLISLAMIILLICNTPREHFIIKRLLTVAYPIILAANFGIIYLFPRLGGFGNPIIAFINDGIFNGRIGLAVMNLNTYHVSLLGSKIDSSIVAANNMYSALDNGYTIILLYYGIIGLIWYSYIQVATAKKMAKIDELTLMVALFIINYWGIYEGQMVSLGGNFMVIAFLANITYGKYSKNSGSEQIGAAK